jgi:glycine betaine catabolism B
MLDANRNEENILYKQEFDSWQNLNKNLKIVYALELEQQQQQEQKEEKSDQLKWNGEIGRINKDMVMKYLNADDFVNAVFYICGPPGMLNAMKNLLTTEMGITKGRIREEEFYGY